MSCWIGQDEVGVSNTAGILLLLKPEQVDLYSFNSRSSPREIRKNKILMVGTHTAKKKVKRKPLWKQENIGQSFTAQEVVGGAWATTNGTNPFHKPGRTSQTSRKVAAWNTNPNCLQPSTSDDVPIVTLTEEISKSKFSNVENIIVCFDFTVSTQIDFTRIGKSVQLSCRREISVLILHRVALCMCSRWSEIEPAIRIWTPD